MLTPSALSLRERQVRSRVLVMIGAALACASAVADEEGGAREDALQMEVAPFAGYSLGGSFNLSDTGQNVNLNDRGSFAVALDLNANPGAQYELFYSRQVTKMSGTGFAPADVRVEYLQIGGTEILNDETRIRPYLVGTLGLTRFSPGGAQGNQSTKFSISLGAGLRVPFGQHFALRLEGRGFATVLNTNGAVFCRSDQAGLLCNLRARGSVFTQGELLLGAAYAF